MRFTSEAFYREAFNLPSPDVLREALDRGVAMVGDGFVVCAAVLPEACCSATFLTDEIEFSDGERLAVGRVYYLDDVVAAYCTTYEMWDPDGRPIVLLAGQLVPAATSALLFAGRSVTWLGRCQQLGNPPHLCMVGAEFVHTPGFVNVSE